MIRPLWREILYEILIGLWVLAAVVFGWRHSWLLSLVLGASLLVQALVWRTKTDLLVMLFAALIGPATEAFCVKMGIWSYHAPGMIWGVPFWLPLVWANLFCLFRRIAVSMSALSDVIWPDGNLSARVVHILAGLIVAVYCIVTLVLIRRNIAIVYAIFLVPAGILWHRKSDVFLFIVGGSLGTVGEFISIKLGFWEYHFPYFKSIGLPLSLPLAWGLCTVIFSGVSNWVDVRSQQSVTKE